MGYSALDLGDIMLPKTKQVLYKSLSRSCAICMYAVKLHSWTEVLHIESLEVAGLEGFQISLKTTTNFEKSRNRRKNCPMVKKVVGNVCSTFMSCVHAN